MIENFKNYLQEIKESINSVLRGSKTYLFGSVVEGNQVAGNDVDVLIIAEVPKSHLKRAELIAEIEEKANLPLIHPFEFHLLTEKEFQTWKDVYHLTYQEISSSL